MITWLLSAILAFPNAAVVTSSGQQVMVDKVLDAVELINQVRSATGYSLNRTCSTCPIHGYLIASPKPVIVFYGSLVTYNYSIKASSYEVAEGSATVNAGLLAAIEDIAAGL